MCATKQKRRALQPIGSAILLSDTMTGTRAARTGTTLNRIVSGAYGSNAVKLKRCLKRGAQDENGCKNEQSICYEMLQEAMHLVRSSVVPASQLSRHEWACEKA